MLRLLADPRLRRAALDPGLLGRAVGHALTAPWRRAEEARWRRERPGHLGNEYLPTTTDPAPWPVGGPRVVFLGLGLGEFMMARRVGEALRATRPDAEVAYALRDGATVDDLRRRHPGARFLWWPPDGYPAALHWLGEIRPDVLVLTEGYREPFFAAAAARFGARVALQNGRVQYRKSFDRFPQRGFYRWLFGAFDALATRTEEFADNARRVARPGAVVRATGDLKADHQPPPLAPERLASLERWLQGESPLVGAGSTDGLDEERMVLDALTRARESVPCRLLVAPRQMRGAAPLAEEARRRGLSVSLRSEEGGSADVMLLDTQGELAHAYGACRAAYVGGSYAAKGGGHNPLEPLALGVPVAYGTTRGTFEAIQSMLEARGVAARVGGAEELAAFFARFLTDDAARERIGIEGRAIVEEGRGAIAATVAMLLPLLPSSHSG